MKSITRLAAQAMMRKNPLICLFLSSSLLTGCASSGLKSGYYIDDVYEEAKRYYESRDYEEAKKYYMQFNEQHPDSPLNEVTMYHVADCYRQTSEYDKALEAYQALIDKYQDGFWANLARDDMRDIQVKQQSN